jgi:glycosyltransferase involved in cell wall biosynthesis
MRILILTQYFPPEVGAPQNRLLEMARVLRHEGNEVEVLTAMPNYPALRIEAAYRGRMIAEDRIDRIRVIRTWIYASPKKTFVRRLLNYFSFVLSSFLGAVRTLPCDVVICESPPLFLGFSGWVIAVFKRASFVFNISDLWPESAERLGIVSKGAALSACYALEAFLYQRAALVSGQTRGIVGSIKSRFPNVSTHWMPNGVDCHLYQGKGGNPYLDKTNGTKVFIYAGVLGHAQGLEVILDAARRMADRDDIRFVIIGDGPEREKLEIEAREMGDQVSFLSPMLKTEVIARVAEAYGYIVPLRRLDLFKGAIPSKLFDALALGVPILLGVDGEARDLFIDEGEGGLYFEPENGGALSEAVLRLVESVELRDELGRKGREFVLNRFDRRRISKSFLDKLSEIDR